MGRITETHVALATVTMVTLTEKQNIPGTSMHGCRYLSHQTSMSRDENVSFLGCGCTL